MKFFQEPFMACIFGIFMTCVWVIILSNLLNRDLVLSDGKEIIIIKEMQTVNQCTKISKLIDKKYTAICK